MAGYFASSRQTTDGQSWKFLRTGGVGRFCIDRGSVDSYEEASDALASLEGELSERLELNSRFGADTSGQSYNLGAVP